jgi:L-threonylcarbamoyladenylate synthase
MRETQIISANDPLAIGLAIRVFSRGGLVAFPTDTVYGVGSSAFSEAGINALFEAKGRDYNKAIAVLLGTVEQIDQVTSGLTEAARRLAARFWPGALTLVVPRRPNLPENISPYPTVGLRIPDHAFARELMSKSGPLATTSANLSGGENPLSAQDVLDQLGGRIDLVIDGGQTKGGVPSTVVDCTAAQIKVLREGPIPAKELYEVAGENL